MIRVEAILKDPLYQEHIRKNFEKETDRKFCRHTFQHLLDVARITYILLLESGDIEVFMKEQDINLGTARELVYASSLLHDIGRWKEYETGEDHSVASAELAVEILQRAGFVEGEAGIVCRAIREHRRPGETPSLLGRKLNRGDKLSRMCSLCEARDECYKIDQMETGSRMLVY